MLNMAPDKAADETISFQCYPLSAALLYTSRPALIAVLLRFFFPLSAFSHLYSSLFISACIGSSFYLSFLLRSQNLPSSSFLLSLLSSFYILFLPNVYPVHVCVRLTFFSISCILHYSTSDIELLIFVCVISQYLSSIMSWIFCIAGLFDAKVVISFLAL